MRSKTNIAPLFANYDTNNKSVNHTDRLYLAGSQRSRISLDINLQDLLHEGKFSTLISFVALWMRSVGIAPKNVEQTVGLSITTMLQHNGRFW